MATGHDVELAAFERIFTDQHDRLLRIAVLFAGDRTHAEDAVAEVFARVLRRFDHLEIDDMGSYLRRCVINELMTSGRRRTKGVELHERADSPTPPKPFDETFDERERVLRALAKLPDRQRAAIVLRYYDDLSEADTAAILGVAIGTVKSSVARGLATLKVLLREEKRHG